jgi:superfamily II DNA/RNA helicase
MEVRGMDIPEINWIVQYDPPDGPRNIVIRRVEEPET